jgi:hypothetical protein
MTTKEALDWYNKATGSTFEEHDLFTNNLPEKPGLRRAVNCVARILQVSELVWRMGGEIQSRQVVAIVIALTPE